MQFLTNKMLQFFPLTQSKSDIDPEILKRFSLHSGSNPNPKRIQCSPDIV